MRNIQSTCCWIGTSGDCHSFRKIFDLGIQAIVQLAAEEPVVQAPRDLLLFRFPLVDGAGNDLMIARLAIDSVRQLIEARIPTLVACSAGMSRSPAILAAALARTGSVNIDESLKRVVGKGSCEMSPALWNEIRNLHLGVPTGRTG